MLGTIEEVVQLQSKISKGKREFPQKVCSAPKMSALLQHLIGLATISTIKAFKHYRIAYKPRMILS